MIPLFDTHMHLIYRQQAGYQWTQGIPSLAEGDCTLEDYLQLVQDQGVAAGLFMETGVDDANYQAETRFVHQLTGDNSNSHIKGIIASIRPESEQEFDAWLEESVDLGVLGYRRILHDMDDALSQSNHFRSNVRKIGDASKTFDICFLARQLPIAAQLAQACDNTTLILNHCGIPNIAGEDMADWKKHTAALADMPHVHCKLSGIVAYCGDRGATLETIKPYVDHLLETFGPARMLWGSDWPVVKLGGDLQHWLSLTRQILDSLSKDEAMQIAHQTTEKVYNCSL